jgi:glucosamine--fructose-6-phosphate aminotransferase (isomerizing)
MCGILGYLGDREARQVLVDCLSRLDNRGYDSAGIGTVGSGRLKTLRSLGSNSSATLKSLLKKTPLGGKIGIADIRWTDGKASPADVHPHTGCKHTIAVAITGTLANYPQLKQELERAGHVFTSEAPGEVIAHLLEQSTGDIESALKATLPRLEGSFALVVLSQHEPDKILVARNGGMSFVIGQRPDGYFIASDSPAIEHYTRNMQVLEDGEIAVVAYDGVRISKFDGTPVAREFQQMPPAARSNAGHVHSSNVLPV